MMKTKSPSKVLRPYALALVVLSTLLVPTTSRAQPPETTFNAEVVTREWAQLRDETELLEIRDPRAAIARYQKFYESRARLLPGTAIAVASLIAQLYWYELRDDKKAVEVYEAALQEYDWFNGSARLERELMQVQAGKIKIAPVKISSFR